MTCDLSEFLQSPYYKINYSSQSLPSSLTIIPEDVLFDKKIVKQKIIVSDIEHIKVLFANGNSGIGFDIFAATFYMATRYEEYFFDAHFHNENQHIAVQHHFHDLPIIHVWFDILMDYIKKDAESFPIVQPSYSFRLTYDIDHHFAYLNKSFIKNSYHVLREFFVNFRQFTSRINVLLQKEQDPWINFDFQNECNKQLKNMPFYFFHAGIHHNAFDNNLSPNHISYKRSINTVKTNAHIGLHPSYQSNFAESLQYEKCILEELSQRDILHSRQHFLFIRFPDTYKRLIEAGIMHDHTMGYAKCIGYRAGMGRPFYWFDLKCNEITKLLLHPFVVMDVTLKNYLMLSPLSAIAKLNEVHHTAIKYKCELEIIWHNSSLGECLSWNGWRSVYLHSLKLDNA